MSIKSTGCEREKNTISVTNTLKENYYLSEYF